MKILFCSNAPWAKTGYGQQGASLASRMRDAGHTVAYYCNYGLEAGRLEWNGMTMFPNGLEGGYVDPIVQGHIRTFQPDLIFTLFDVWVLRGKDFPLPASSEYPAPRWAAWIPVDHDPLSAANRNVIPRIDYPIAMSQHGHDQMNAAGLKNTYIPHGIEKGYGYTPSGRAEHRRLHQLPENAFLFGSVGLNRNYPNRKALDRLLQAMAELDDDRAYLYLHTLPASQVGSMELTQIVDFYGLGGRVKFPDAYSLVSGMGQMAMNSVYSSLDCYVQPTMGEGFGLPVLEAQACGCPVIATDCTSMPEICCPNTSELIAADPFMVPDVAHRYLVRVPDMVEKMREVMRIYYDDQTGHKCMKANAARWANNWDWDTLWKEQWLPFLEKVQADVNRAPRKKWRRGQAIIVEKENTVVKRDSTLKSPAVAKELVFLEKYRHPNIIPVLASGVDDTAWFEMPKHRSLRDIDPKEMTDKQKETVLKGVRAAIEYLHENEVAHRDIAPENVVIDDNWNPYLIDFEWAHACMGDKCVDLEPWSNLEMAVPVMQTGGSQRGFHTIINYINGLPLDMKTHGWKGVPYQQVDGVGERDCQIRWDIMKPDVKGKTVLDLGSNLGWFCRKASEEGATEVVGIENDGAVAQSAAILSNGHRIKYVRTDIEKWEPDTRFDVGFALSVLQHLPDPDPVMDRLMEMCNEVYLEIPQRFITERIGSYLEGAEFLGESERGRPIYRVTA